MTGQGNRPVREGDVIAAVIPLLVLVLAAWLLPVSATLVSSGHLPHLSVIRAVSGTVRLVGSGAWRHPAIAYPSSARTWMPGPAGWWAASGGSMGALGLVALALWRRLEPAAARERLDRRPGDLRGARPRTWGRRRDLRRGRRGFSVGRIDGRRAFTDEEAHVAVVAPTRAGKTTRCIVPWLLAHDGPAIVTSTKRDVLDATRAARVARAPIWIYDPFNAGSASWNPLDGCDSWSYALRQARWLADAAQDGDSEIARYWRGEAAKLLAPLLHAAAVQQLTIGDVVRWLDGQVVEEPNLYLHACGADAAARQLEAVRALDDRNRGTTYMSAGSVLSAYRYPEILATSGSGFAPEAFLDGTAHTLYLVASERHQRLLAPILVALLSSVLNLAMERLPDRKAPRLRVLLDEAANVTPLNELPRLLAQGAGHGIRFATVWQSLGQLRERYRNGADSILANSTAKLFMGPITDEATRGYVRGLLGEEPPRLSSVAARRQRVTAASLQQLERGRALLIEGARVPMVVRLPSQRRWRRSGSRPR